MASYRCPNCGTRCDGGFIVCEDCGKVFCSDCDRNGKNPFTNGVCPRCASSRYVYVKDWDEMKQALRNSQN